MHPWSRNALLVLALGFAPSLHAQPIDPRIPADTYETIPNTVSNVEFFASNFGAFGRDLLTANPSLFWPRESRMSYVRGAGLWFGARKRIDGALVAMSVAGYDPSPVASSFVPGGVRDRPSVSINRVYRSSDYDRTSGMPLDVNDLEDGGVRWPIWSTDGGGALGRWGYAGTYIHDAGARSPDISGAPVFASDEDFVATFHDDREDRIGIEVEEAVHSWRSGPMKDVVVIRYRTINTSPDTLFDAYVAMAIDCDVGYYFNDRSKIAIELAEDDSLDLAVAWNATQESYGQYAYIGFDLFETPIVDVGGFVVPRSESVGRDRQIGLRTFQSYFVGEDPYTPAERYEFMAAGDRDGDDAHGDKRQLLATGPFHLRPGDTVTMSIGLLFARGVNNVTDGTWASMASLVELDLYAQRFFENTFMTNSGGFSSVATPSPPSNPPLRVYPSPTRRGDHSIVTLELAVERSAAARVRIVNAVGENVAGQELGLLSAGAHTLTIAVDALQSGAYMVVVEAGGATHHGTLLVRD